MRAIIFFGLFLGLTACSDKVVDNDSDGFTSDLDCDDNNAAIHPNAEELCDTIDNNCDGNIDEDPVDATVFYADADGDAYGDPNVTAEACTAPENYVEDPTDCDDTRSDINPAADEVCDELDTDEDCDGLADDLDDSTHPDSMVAYHLDQDQDGYGAEDATAACEDPSTETEWWTEDGTDCNDNDEAIHPGATEGIADGVDSDCDGGEICYVDADSDGWLVDKTATVVSEDADCGEPGEGAASDPTGDCNDNDPQVYPGAPELFDFQDNDCDGTGDRVLATEADAKFVSEAAHDYAGYVLDIAGDVNGDGFADMIVGAYGTDRDGSSNAGSAYLILGAATGITDMNLSAADVKFLAVADGDHLGTAVAHGLDVNNDGYDDLLLGAIYGESDKGASYLVLGGCDGAASCGGTKTGLFASVASGEMDLSDADVTFVGENVGDYAGYTIASAGDVDGDGYQDIVLGALGAGGTGAAYFVRGGCNGSTDCGGTTSGLFASTSSGRLDLSLADARFNGEDAGDRAGLYSSGVGDLNGDGHDDLLIGALDHNGSRGAAYLLLGGCNGDAGCGGAVTGFFAGLSSGEMELADSDAKFMGEVAGDYAGIGVIGVGDVNGDGYDDTMIGAAGNDEVDTSAGATYLLLGGCDGSADCGGTPTGFFASLTAGEMGLEDCDIKFTGEGKYDNAGVNSQGGDINDDGYIDLIIGAQGEASAAGAFYVLLGGCDGSADCGGVATGFFSHVSSGSISLSHADARITGEDSSSYLSGPAQTGISVGDVNGDGIDDIFAGAHEDDSSALNGGSAYLFFGR